MRKKLPPENFAELQKGKTVQQIAEACGVCYCTAFRWLREAGIHKRRGKEKKPVRAFKDGKLFKEYPSLTEAGKDLFVSINAISAALNGRTKTAAGYRWEYAEARGEQ